MDTRHIERAIDFAIDEVRYEISLCIINRDFKTAEMLNEIKEMLYNASNKLPF